MGNYSKPKVLISLKTSNAVAYFIDESKNTVLSLSFISLPEFWNFWQILQAYGRPISGTLEVGLYVMPGRAREALKLFFLHYVSFSTKEKDEVLLQFQSGNWNATTSLIYNLLLVRKLQK